MESDIRNQDIDADLFVAAGELLLLGAPCRENKET